MRSEHSLCLAPLDHCRCYDRHLVAGHRGGDCTSPAQRRSSSDRSHPVSFLLVFINLLPIYFTVWLLFLPISFVVHLFHGDVKVGAHTETIHTHRPLLGACWYTLHTSRTIIYTHQRVGPPWHAEEGADPYVAHISSGSGHNCGDLLRSSIAVLPWDSTAGGWSHRSALRAGTWATTV